MALDFPEDDDFTRDDPFPPRPAAAPVKPAPKLAPKPAPPSTRYIVVERIVQPVTIELTAKRWKALMLIGAMFCGIGVLIVAATDLRTGFSFRWPQSLIEGPAVVPYRIGFGFFAVGFVGWCAAKVMAWWHHG